MIAVSRGAGSDIAELPLEQPLISRVLSVGIVHVSMDAERDAYTADLRRSRNFEVVKTFQENSEIAGIYFYYFVPLAAAVAAWTSTKQPIILPKTYRIVLV
jgi:hypothetical protein